MISILNSKTNTTELRIDSFFQMTEFFLKWPSGKSVRLGSCRLGFDSESGQTIDFKIGNHRFTA